MQLQTLLKVSLSFFTGRGCSARARPTVSPLSRARDLDRSVSQSRDRRGIHCRGRNVEEGRSEEKSARSRERGRKFANASRSALFTVHQRDAFRSTSYSPIFPFDFFLFFRRFHYLIDNEISIIFAAKYALVSLSLFVYRD